MRRHLADYGKRQLEQPGMEHLVNGAFIESRQRTLVDCDASNWVSIPALLSGPEFGRKRSVIGAGWTMGHHEGG